MELKIDEELKNLISPLSKEEYESLEKSLKENGYDDAYPISIWNDTILDGHNRYEICQKYGISYTVKVREFPDRNHAVNWIIDNQLSRRNITSEQRKYLIGKKYLEEKKVIGKDFIPNPEGINQHKGKESDEERLGAHFEHLTSKDHKSEKGSKPKTSGKIAKESGVSQSTVRRSAEYAKAIDIIAENVNMLPQVLMSDNKTRMTVREAIELSNLDPDLQKSVIDDALKGKVNINVGIRKAKKESRLKAENDKAKESLEKHPVEGIPKITLINADSFQYAYPPEFKADLIITDIPYNYSQDNHFNGMDRSGLDFGKWDHIENYDDFMGKVSSLINERLKDNGSFYIFCSVDEISTLQKKLENENLNVMRVLFWKKTNPFPLRQNRMYYADVEVFLWGSKRKGNKWTFNLGDTDESDKWSALFEYPVVSGDDRSHPTQKPLSLLKELILNSSNPGELVFDPFSGSGSAAVASLQCGRNFFGIEINSSYIEKADQWILREKAKLVK